MLDLNNMNVGDLVRTTHDVHLGGERLFGQRFGPRVSRYGTIVKIIGGPGRDQPAWRVTILSGGELIDTRPWLLEKT